jgi:DNA-binding IclR family transcriptional regulator
LTQQSIDQILRMLRDGKWHDMSEIAERTKLSSTKMQRVTDFLAKYTFIEVNHENQKMKLSPTLTEFLQKIHAPKTRNIA